MLTVKKSHDQLNLHTMSKSEPLSFRAIHVFFNTASFKQSERRDKSKCQTAQRMVCVTTLTNEWCFIHNHM